MTGLLLHVALFPLGTTHDCAIGQAGPSILSKSHFERPASNTIAQNPLRGDARGTMRCALLMAKGSLFLGRLTELSDGVSVLLEAAS